MKIGDMELRITPASFEDAIDLKDAIEESIKAGKLNLDLDTSNKEVDTDKDIMSLSEVSPESITSMINTLLSIDNSKRVRAALFRCAERALLGNDKIDRDFFEKIENRQYYYEIMFEIIKVNVIPFFKGLFLKLSTSGAAGIGAIISNILKQK